MEEKKESRHRFSPALRMALISLIICGLIFPLLVTGFAQVLLPYQANGEIVSLNGQNVGSNLIAQNFNSSVFFHPRNDSASSVDPDITLQDAFSQVPRISQATGILPVELNATVNQNIEGAFWVFGSPYVNVLTLNRILILNHPSVYANFTR